jgi:hypothetical protein
MKFGFPLLHNKKISYLKSKKDMVTLLDFIKKFVIINILIKKLISKKVS